MIHTSRTVTLFAEYEDSTKRLKISTPNTIEELHEALREKFPSLGACKIQVKDAEFQVMCDLEDVDQIYNGAKLKITASSKAKVSKIEMELENEDETFPPIITEENDEMRERLEQLEQENLNLRNQIQGEEDLSPKRVPEGYTVRLYGLPFDCTEEKVEKFFENLTIVEDGIYILRQYKSNVVRGEALVTFATESDQDEALLKHKEKIGKRWIEVRKAEDSDIQRYYDIQEAYHYLATPRDLEIKFPFVVKMRGFEWNHRVEDVSEFLEMEPKKVWIMWKKRPGKSTVNSGICYCELENQKELQHCMAKKKAYLGSRWIDVWQATFMEFRISLAEMCGEKKKIDFPGCVNLRMEGIPRDANDQELAKFFRSVGIIPKCIHRKISGDNAFVEFQNEDECKIALTKHSQHIFERYITLKPVTAHEVSRMIGDQRRSMPPVPIYEERIRERVEPVYEERILPQARPRTSYRFGEQIRESRGTNPWQPPVQSAHTSRYSPYELPARGPPPTRPVIRSHPAIQQVAQRGATPKNATVKMASLDYAVTVDDLREFWNDFSYIEGSIKILEKNGKSTGTGRITFESVEEAERAIKEKHGQYVGDRWIRLSYWKQFR